MKRRSLKTKLKIPKSPAWSSNSGCIEQASSLETGPWLSGNHQSVGESLHSPAHWWVVTGDESQSLWNELLKPSHAELETGQWPPLSHRSPARKLYPPTCWCNFYFESENKMLLHLQLNGGEYLISYWFVSPLESLNLHVSHWPTQPSCDSY